MHILVVEDERALCETIVQSLRRLAYSVDFCFDGDEALFLLESERFDLIVLDLNLPGADGMTVLRTLRTHDRDTRVLILSARSEVSDKVAGLDAGANDYLAKPFHLAELEARIRSLTLRQFTQQDVLLRLGNSPSTRRQGVSARTGSYSPSPKKNSAFLSISCSTGGVRSVRRNYWTMSGTAMRTASVTQSAFTSRRSAKTARCARLRPGYQPYRRGLCAHGGS